MENDPFHDVYVNDDEVDLTLIQDFLLNPADLPQDLVEDYIQELEIIPPPLMPYPLVQQIELEHNYARPAELQTQEVVMLTPAVEQYWAAQQGQPYIDFLRCLQLRQPPPAPAIVLDAVAEIQPLQPQAPIQA